jgi:hypothetical protein
MLIWPLTLAVNGKTAAIVGGVVALTTLSSYGLGYLKGANRAHASSPQQPIESHTERSSDSARMEQRQEQSATNTDEDMTVVETKLPPKTLPDGSIEQRTRIQRKTAKQESVDATAGVQAQTVEKIVEKRVEVPCPEALPNPFETHQAALPRWMAGPSVARDFSLDKTVFGGSLAVRAGPVWFRVFADSHPQAGLSAEVTW